jgi:hypothetical protein
MKKILFSLLLLQSFLFNFAFSKEASLEVRANILEGLVTKFEHCCIGTNEQLLDKAMCVDKSAIQKNGPVLTCASEARRLAKMLTLLNKEVTLHNNLLKKQSAGQCAVDNTGAYPINGSEVMSMMSTTKQIQSKITAGKKCEVQSGSECAGDMACNLTRSILSRPTILLKLLPDDYRPKVPKCLDAAQSDCMTEFIAGVLTDLWSNLEGIWELGKMAVKGTKSAIIGAWDWATGVEDKTSNAAHLASKQSESSIKLFLKDPIAFLKKVGLEIWNMLTAAVYDNFGCEQWKGVPHMSKCLKPMSNWGCSSCNQKINAVCGVAGILGGEVVMAYFTGGAANLAGKAGAKGLQSMGKISAILAKSLPKTTKALKTVTATAGVAAKTITIPFTRGIEVATKVLKSETSLKILEFAKKGAAPIKATAVAVGKSKPITLTVKIIKGVTSPVSAYVGLLDDSFKAGMMGAEKLVAKDGAKMLKYSEAMKAAEKIGDVDELVIPTSQAEGMSPDLLKSQLNENKILFEEVELPDGTIMEKFKIDSSCPIKR